MPSLEQIYQDRFSQNRITRRVVGAVLKAADCILVDEDSGAANHGKRLAWARAAMTDPVEMASRIQTNIAVRCTIPSLNDTSLSAADPDDADLETIVNNLIDAYALAETGTAQVTGLVDVTTVTGVLKGDGAAISAAVAGRDYLAPDGAGSALTGITQSQVADLTTDLSAKAPLASPSFTGRAKLDAYYATVLQATDEATVTFDLSACNWHTVTITDDRTLTLSGMSAGQLALIEIVQGAGGSHTVTWSDTIRWANGTAPILTVTAGHADLITIWSRGDGTYSGVVTIANY